MIRNRLKKMIPVGEYIEWEGRPNKTTMILESIFNFMLPIAFVWLLFDGTFIIGMFYTENKQPLFFTIPFFALHLMPVWIYLGMVLTAWKRYANTSYIITEKKIYTSGGVGYSQKSMPLKEITNIEFNQGTFDRMYSVGDVAVRGQQTGYSNKHGAQYDYVHIDNIHDFEQVYHKLCDLTERAKNQA